MKRTTAILSSVALLLASCLAAQAQDMAPDDEVLPPEALSPAVLLGQFPLELDRTWTYTTADPVRSDLLGLATQDGRYSFLPLEGCVTQEWTVRDYQEVALYVVPGHVAWIAPLDTTGGASTRFACSIQVQARMSTTPCFVDARGVCDVNQEFDQEDSQ